jgi:hypothetical protein
MDGAASVVRAGLASKAGIGSVAAEAVAVADLRLVI